MDECQTFSQQRWPLHFALAWVLTRDRMVAERAKPSQYHPSLTTERDAVDRAWRMLHEALENGCVPAFRNSPSADILPQDFASLDWTDLTKDDGIVVSSNAMMFVFPFSGAPVEFTSDQIGPPIPPDGSGYMTLSDAAYWIATDAGTKQIEARDLAVWQGAFYELLPRVQSGEVQVVGRRRGAATPEIIAPASFVGLRVDYPYFETPKRLFFGPGPHIKCCGPLIPDSLTDQTSDELFGGNRDAAGWHKPEWSHLQVACVEIKKFWPFSKPSAGPPADRNDRPLPQRGRRESIVPSIKRVIDELWPDGIPDGLRKERRNKAINDKLKVMGLGPASHRNINRALTGK